jgi:hypothetical protein
MLWPERCLTHETPIPGHRSGDLGQCCFRSVEQVQGTATEYRIQGIVQEGKAEGTASNEQKIPKSGEHRLLPGLSKHRQGEIKPDHPARSLRCERAGKQSRTARQIQDVTPLLRLQPLDQICGELSKGRGARKEEPQGAPVFLINRSDWRKLHQALEGSDDFAVGTRKKV